MMVCFVHLLKKEISCATKIYLSNVFDIFNNINSSMQGQKENMLNCTDKLVGFQIYKLYERTKHSQVIWKSLSQF